jgi:hypothetical protein
MGAVGVLLMECRGFHGCLFEFISYSHQENGPAQPGHAPAIACGPKNAYAFVGRAG